MSFCSVVWKPWGLHSNPVNRDREQGDQVMAGIVGLRLAGKAGVLRGGLHRRARNYCAGFIGNRAGKAAGRLAVQEWDNMESTNEQNTPANSAFLFVQH